MKILLILPHDSMYRYEGFFRRSISYAPLTLTTLAALIPPEIHAQVDIVDEGVQPAQYDNVHADVVGISGVTASAPRAYSLADHFRQRGALVVMGGVHATLNPENALQHADIVVRGYAEEVWPRLLRDHAAGRQPRGILQSHAKARLSAPAARRDLQRAGAYMRYPSMIATRGCRHACSYCSLNSMSESHTCARPVDEVVEEIRSLGKRMIVFLDPNLADERDYALHLMEALIPLGIRWASSATVDIAEDNELLALLQRSGCMGLLLGIDSVSQTSMDKSGKPFNKVKQYTRAIRTLQARDVAVMACFMFGFDGDTKTVFDDTLSFLDEARPDLVRFGVLTPFPGTRQFTDFKRSGRIRTEDWALYDTQHVVYNPLNMTAEDLQAGLFRVWREAFSISRIASRARQAGCRWPLSLATNIGMRYYGKRVMRAANAGKGTMPCA